MPAKIEMSDGQSLLVEEDAETVARELGAHPFWTFTEGSGETVAVNSAQVLRVRPSDQARYGRASF